MHVVMHKGKKTPFVDCCQNWILHKITNTNTCHPPLKVMLGWWGWWLVDYACKGNCGVRVIYRTKYIKTPFRLEHGNYLDDSNKTKIQQLFYLKLFNRH